MVITYGVIGLVPISDKNSVVTGWVWERDRNSRPAKDPDPSKSTSSFVECQRWEVVEAPNLILHLKNVSKVFPRRDWACCSKNTIFVRVPPLLNSIPILQLYIFVRTIFMLINSSVTIILENAK